MIDSYTKALHKYLMLFIFFAFYLLPLMPFFMCYQKIGQLAIINHKYPKIKIKSIKQLTKSPQMSNKNSTYGKNRAKKNHITIHIVFV